MAELTVEQLDDFRADIGDTGNARAFTDAELQRLYKRAGTYNKAVLMAFNQLISSTAKFTDYTQNDTQEKKSQVFDHLMDTRKIWAALVEGESSTGGKKRQVAVVGLNPERTRRSKPNA